MFMEKRKKKAVTAFDDKRVEIENGRTLAIGHKSLVK